MFLLHLYYNKLRPFICVVIECTFDRAKLIKNTFCHSPHYAHKTCLYWIVVLLCVQSVHNPISCTYIHICIHKWIYSYMCNCVSARATFTQDRHDIKLESLVCNDWLWNYVPWTAYRILLCCVSLWLISLQWRHNEHDGLSNHQRVDSLLNRLFRPKSKKPSKLRVTGLCEGNSPVTGEFPTHRSVTRKMFPFDDVIMK